MVTVESNKWPFIGNETKSQLNNGYVITRFSGSVSKFNSFLGFTSGDVTLQTQHGKLFNPMKALQRVPATYSLGMEYEIILII